MTRFVMTGAMCMDMMCIMPRCCHARSGHTFSAA